MVDNEENDISGENEAISFDEEKWHFESREADHGVTFNLLGRQISCFSHCSLLYIGTKPAFHKLSGVKLSLDKEFVLVHKWIP